MLMLLMLLLCCRSADAAVAAAGAVPTAYGCWCSLLPLSLPPKLLQRKPPALGKDGVQEFAARTAGTPGAFRKLRDPVPLYPQAPAMNTGTPTGVRRSREASAIRRTPSGSVVGVLNPTRARRGDSLLKQLPQASGGPPALV